MVMSVEKLTSPVVMMPTTPADWGTDKCSATEKCMWEQEVKESIRDEKEVTMLGQKQCALVMGRTVCQSNHRSDDCPQGFQASLC